MLILRNFRQLFRYVEKSANSFLFCGGRVINDSNFRTFQKYIPFTTTSDSVVKGTQLSLGVENTYFHEMFENNSAYSETIYVPSDLFESTSVTCENLIKNDWNSETTEYIIHELEIHSSMYSKVSTDSNFNSLCSTVANRCTEYSDLQLLKVLECILKWPRETRLTCHNCLTLWQALDKECQERLRNWSIKKILLFADLWFLTYVGRKSKYMSDCIWYLGKRLKYLSHSEFVQLMFYINDRRSLGIPDKIFDVEWQLRKLIHHMSLDEIAVVCLTFVTLKKKLQIPDLMNYIMQELIDNIDNIHEISFIALLKLLHYTIPISLEQKFLNLLNSIAPKVPQLSIIGCIHVAILGTNNELLHRDLFNAVSQRFVNEIKQVRLKDVERMCSALAVYNYTPNTEPDIEKVILEELSCGFKTDELLKFPRTFPCILSHLSIRGIYCEDFINYVLSSKFILETYGRAFTCYDNSLLWLDVGVEVERPLYQGNRLSEKARAFLAKSVPKVVPDYIPEHLYNHLGSGSLMLFSFMDLCWKMFGKSNVYVGHVLPQFKIADVIIGVRGGTELIPIPKYISQWKSGLLKRAPQDEQGDIWYALVLGNHRSFIRGTATPVGYVEAKIRQLKLIGYQPVLVPWFDWMPMNSEGKKVFLKKTLFQENAKETEEMML